MNPNHNQVKLIFLTLILLLVHNVFGWNKFCSVYCQNQECNSPISNDCVVNMCASGLTWSTTTLDCQPASGYALQDTFSDTGGSLKYNISTITTCGPAGGDGSAWSYTYYENLIGSTAIQFTNYNGVTLPHYQLRIIIGIILIDNWQGSDTISVILNNNQIKTQNRNSRQTQ